MTYWQQPDWNKLYITGRCRSIWVAWTSEEQGILAKTKSKDERDKMVAILRSTGVEHSFEKKAVQPAVIEEPTLSKMETVKPEIEEPLELVEPEITEEAVYAEAMKQATAQYLEKFGKKPHRKMKLETILAKLEE